MIYRELNNNTKQFFLGTFIIYLVVRGVFFTFAGIFLKEAGFLEGFVGRTLSCTTLSIALSSVLSSYLIKNYGYKKIIISGIIFTGIGAIGLVSTLNPAMILFSASLMGMGFSMHMTSEGAFLMENVSEEKRVKVFSYNFALKNIGIIAGTFLGGRLSDLLKINFTGLSSLRMIFLLFATLLFSFAVPINKITENKIEREWTGVGEYLKSYRRVVRGRVVKFLLYNSTIGFGAGLVVPFFSIYLKYTLDIGNSLVGTILSIAQMGVAAGGLLVPLLAKKVGREKTVILCQLLSIPFLISIAFPQGIVIITISFLIRSTLMNLNHPIVQNLSMEMVGEDERPMLSSLFTLSGNLTRALGMVAGGYLMEKVSYNAPYYFTIIFYLSGTYLFYRLFGRGGSKNVSP